MRGLSEVVPYFDSVSNEYRRIIFRRDLMKRALKKSMKRTLAVFVLLSAMFSMAVAQRLPEVAVPENYKLTFKPNLEKATFEGDETISIRVLKPTSEITLNAADIDFHEVTITSGGATQKASGTYDKEKEMVVLTVAKSLPAGPATIHITYAGILNSE